MLSKVMRTIHKWVAIGIALPIIVVLVTGIVLQVRKPVEWIQPSAARGTATFDPQVSQAQVLSAVRGVPEMAVAGWDDILVTDYRPRKGIVKVRSRDHYEIQVDARTGAVVKQGQRWNDRLSRIHDGSAWGARLWLFLPAAVLAFLLSLSGLYLAVTSSVRRLGALKRRQLEPTRAPAPFSLVRFCLKYHYWLSLIVAGPWLVVMASGIVLQLRYEIPGVFNAVEPGAGGVPTIRYEEVLDVARGIPELGVKGWSDVWRVYTYPDKGTMQVRTKRGLEAQIDAGSGQMLAVMPRGGDFWEDLHEGIIGRHQLHTGDVFGGVSANLAIAVFLPTHLVALVLWFTGLVYFLRTTVFRSQPARARRDREVLEGGLEPQLGPLPDSGRA